MAQNITTLLQKDDASELTMNDLLYLVQGSGSNRDRKLTLATLMAFVNAHAVAVNAEDENPGYLAEKLAVYEGGAGAFTAGDVTFKPVDTRAGENTGLEAHISHNAVTNDKMAPNSVAESNLVANAVGGSKLNLTPVSNTKIVDVAREDQYTLVDTFSLSPVKNGGIVDLFVNFLYPSTSYPIGDVSLVVRDNLGDDVAEMAFPSSIFEEGEVRSTRIVGRYSVQDSDSHILSLYIKRNPDSESGPATRYVRISYSGFIIS